MTFTPTSGSQQSLNLSIPVDDHVDRRIHRFSLRARDAQRRGLWSDRCIGCRCIRDDRTPQVHSEECRASIERMLIAGGDPRVVKDLARTSWQLTQGKELTKRPRSDSHNGNEPNTLDDNKKVKTEGGAEVQQDIQGRQQMEDDLANMFNTNSAPSSSPSWWESC